MFNQQMNLKKKIISSKTESSCFMDTDNLNTDLISYS